MAIGVDHANDTLEASDFPSACTIWQCAIASKSSTAEPTYAERLGWPAGSRVVIFHVDDAGMSHDSNSGAIEAVEKGVAPSMSIMFPCPWVTEIVRYVKKHPAVDAGIHITLTSEWSNYRWGPLSGKKQVPGLVDQDGYLWHNVLQVTRAARGDEVETEIRAQLERCRMMGLTPTHLDTHMGTVFANLAFLQCYVNIGIETGIPVMLPAGHMEHLAANMPLLATPLAQSRGQAPGRETIGRRPARAGRPVYGRPARQTPREKGTDHHVSAHTEARCHAIHRPLHSTQRIV